MNKVLLNITFFLLLLSSQAFTQEQKKFSKGWEAEIDLMYNNALTPSSSNIIQRVYEGNYFVIDTLDIPIYDDFSINKQKNLQNADPNLVVDSLYTSFTFSGDTLDSIYYSLDTTYNFIFNNSTSSYDTVPTNKIEIFIYDNPSNISAVSDTIQAWWGWQYTINNGDTVDSVLVNEVDILTNPDTISYVLDDGFSIWMDEYKHVFVNNTFAVDPITIGVATFDGLMHNGEPYDDSDEDSFGSADYLTSKPIYLDYLPVDSIFLSFYYQAGGYGNLPDAGDSLILEFFNPSAYDRMWHSVWSVNGTESVNNFTEVKIPIMDTTYLKKGFQFRFRNLATLSGHWDIWHIDYVKLDQDRTFGPEDLQDVAYLNPVYSLIHDYSRMPWDHYKLSPSGEVVGSINVSMVNLSNGARFVQRYDAFYDYDQTLLQEQDQVINSGSFPSGKLSFDISISDAPNSFTFPTNGEERSTFLFKDYIDVTPDENRDNDTLRFQQVFDTYYAYDDGTAEKGYIIDGVGSRVAQKYITDVEDTLKAVLFYFPRNYIDFTTEEIKVQVWKNIETQELLYEQLVNPVYSEQRDGFVRFPIIDATVIVNGEFYIGLENLGSDDVYLGLDKNNDHKDKFSFYIDEAWFNSEIEGTVMMRADFGDANLWVGMDELSFKEEVWNVFPNPVDDWLYITSNTEKMVDQFYIYNMLGQPILNGSGNTINVKSLNVGMYILTWVDLEGNIYTEKIQVSD